MAYNNKLKYTVFKQLTLDMSDNVPETKKTGYDIETFSFSAHGSFFQVWGSNTNNPIDRTIEIIVYPEDGYLRYGCRDADYGLINLKISPEARILDEGCIIKGNPYYIAELVILLNNFRFKYGERCSREFKEQLEIYLKDLKSS